MDTREKWNYFCKFLEPLKSADEVAVYQPTIVNLLSAVLGWTPNEVIRNYKFAAGHTGVICDIVLEKGKDIQIVIEVKKGDHKQTPADVQQLESYISLSKCHLGLYIGEKIQLYYDNPKNTSKSELIIESDLTVDSDKGISLFGQLEAENYSKARINSFCERLLLEANQVKTVSNLITDMLANDAEALKDVIVKHYHNANGFPEDIIKKALSQIQFNAIQVAAPAKKPSTAKPLTGCFFIKKPQKNVDATLKVENGKYILLAGSKICSSTVPSLAKFAKDSRDNVVKNYVDQISTSDWVINSEVEFESPSAASTTVLGRSSNGWLDWKDANGKTLGEVYKHTPGKVAPRKKH